MGDGPFVKRGGPAEFSSLSVDETTYAGRVMHDRQVKEEFAGNKTLTLSDSGTLMIAHNASVITLPLASLGIGMTFFIMCGNSIGTIVLDTNVVDNIIGGGITGAANDDFVIFNGKKAGDFIKIVSDGALTYLVQEISGNWIKD